MPIHEPKQVRSGSSAGHPTKKDLVGFMNGELPRAQVSVVVRHLLRGCPECGLVACLAFTLGRRERPKAVAKMPRRVPGRVVPIRWHLERRSALLNQLREAQSQILSISQDLSTIKYRLLGVQASLPAGIAEMDPLLETDATDEATELRTTIACLLKDYLGPAEAALAGTLAQMLKRLTAESEQGEGNE